MLGSKLYAAINKRYRELQETIKYLTDKDYRNKIKIKALTDKVKRFFGMILGGNQ
jgi:hypothetical protein